MNKKIVLELDKNLRDGELLIYKDGKIHSIGLFEILPEYKMLIKDIKDLQAKCEEMDAKIKELRGEDDEEGN